MTLSQLIEILHLYQRAYGDLYVVLANEEEIIGDVASVGISNEGDVVISIMD